MKKNLLINICDLKMDSLFNSTIITLLQMNAFVLSYLNRFCLVSIQNELSFSVESVQPEDETMFEGLK